MLVFLWLTSPPRFLFWGAGLPRVNFAYFLQWKRLVDDSPAGHVTPGSLALRRSRICKASDLGVTRSSVSTTVVTEAKLFRIGEILSESGSGLILKLRLLGAL